MSEWFKCLIPTAHPHPFVQLGLGVAEGAPHPLPLQPGQLQSPTPHCYAPLRAREMGPPRGPEGQSPASPKRPAMLGRGGGVWGRWWAPHASSASALHPGATPPPWCPPAPRGTTVCTFISPRSGAQPGRCLEAGPPEGEDGRTKCSPHEPGAKGGVQGGGGWRRHLGGLWRGSPIC